MSTTLLLFQEVEKDIQHVQNGVLSYADLIIAIAAITTFIFGIYQYRKNIIQNRSTIFLDMRRRYVDDKKFQNLFAFLENDSIELVSVPYKTKMRFLGFYEELAMLVNSKLIRKNVAFYMFGYHAIQAWDSENFWVLQNEDGEMAGRIDKEAIYWSLFKNFVFQMKELEKAFKFKKSIFRI